MELENISTEQSQAPGAAVNSNWAILIISILIIIVDRAIDKTKGSPRDGSKLIIGFRLVFRVKVCIQDFKTHCISLSF